MPASATALHVRCEDNCHLRQVSCNRIETQVHLAILARICDRDLVMDLAPRAADEFLNNRHLAVVKFDTHRKRKLKGRRPG